jgi:acetyl esterase/lipase
MVRFLPLVLVKRRKRSLTVILVLGMAGCQGNSESTASSEALQQPLVHTYREVGDRQLRAHVFLPDEESGTEGISAVLLFHGGGWHLGGPEWTFAAARRFASWGMAAISVEYRLSGDGVTPIDALEDACAAVAWARRTADGLGIDADRVAGYGLSAGGHLVAATATIGCPLECPDTRDCQPDALLLWSPALDTTIDGWFKNLLQGRATSEEYSPAHHVQSSTPPTSIVLGTEDTLTPLSGAKTYCELLIEAGGVCELNLYEGVGHLLTRNLENQESDFDPDPEAEADGIERHRRFLVDMGFIPAGEVSRHRRQPPHPG